MLLLIRPVAIAVSLILILSLADLRAATKQVPGDSSDRLLLLDCVEMLFATPDFIDRLAIEVDSQVLTMPLAYRRLESRIRQVFDEPELSKRLRIVQGGTIEHDWSTGYADITGSNFSPGVLSLSGRASATFRVRRNNVQWRQLIEPRDVELLFAAFPLKNVSAAEVLRKQRDAPAGELEVFVTALQLMEISLKRSTAGWRVTGIDIKNERAYLTITSP